MSHRRLTPLILRAVASVISIGCAMPLAMSQSVAEPPTATPTERVSTFIDQIARGTSSEDRGAVISKILEDMKIPYAMQPFKTRSDGANIIIPNTSAVADNSTTTSTLYPSDPDKPWLVIGAHYDRVRIGQGAVDNGAGCATLMELTKRLHEDPLDSAQVSTVFFDQEEIGLLGSKHYVGELTDRQPTLYLNIDIFAYGDTLWFCTPDPEWPLVKAAIAADETNPLHVQQSAKYPPSDHLSFRAADIPSISVSLLPEIEINEVLNMLAGRRDQPKPRIMAIIHTADDMKEKLKVDQMTAGIDLMETIIRNWDAGHSVTTK